MKNFKQYLAVLLSIVMITALFPVTAFAAAEEGREADPVLIAAEGEIEEEAPEEAAETEETDEAAEPEEAAPEEAAAVEEIDEAAEPEEAAPEEAAAVEEIDEAISQEVTEAEESVKAEEPEETVLEEPEDAAPVGARIAVGDGVEATFNSSTGEVVLYSNGGTLWSYWTGYIGQDLGKIKSIKSANGLGKIYLPEDSSYAFANLSVKELDMRIFNTSKVTSAWRMFALCTNLVKLNLSTFDSSHITNMSYMFYSCESLIELDLSSFDTSLVEGMGGMFNGCSSLKKLNITGFNTEHVTAMYEMFNNCRSFKTLELRSFNTENVRDISYMFAGCSNLQGLILSYDFIIDHCSTDEVFKGCNKLEYIYRPMSFSDSSTAEIKLPVTMFEHYHYDHYDDNDYYKYDVLSKAKYSLSGYQKVLATKNLWQKGDIVGDYVIASYDYNSQVIVLNSDGGNLWYDWQEMVRKLNDLNPTLSDVKTIKMANNSGIIHLPKRSDYLFSSLYHLTSIPLDKFDTSKVTNMNCMFGVCRRLSSFDLSGFDTSHVTDMSAMFVSCENMTSLDVSSFDTSNVTSMERMFDHCAKLQKLDLTAFDTSRVTDMYRMFADCTNLEYLDLSSFDASKVTSADGMFNNTNLQVLKTPKNLKIDVPLGKTMYDASGKAYTYLPKNSKSIRLATTKKKAFEFKDVKKMSLWYYDAVYWAYENDITSGVGDGSYFKPNDDLTRAQAVAFLYKMSGMPNFYYPDPGFKDVKKSDWFYSAVRWAVANNITSGMGTGTFQPGAKCTRAMIVTFLRNYSENVAKTYIPPSATTYTRFSDVPASAWYKRAVDWAVENGITSGYGTGTFRPNVICTRAMMVSFLKKVYELPILSNS